MKITLVRDESGDWIGLYKDGLLVTEGHSLDESRVLEAVGIIPDIKWVDLSNGSGLPQKLDALGLSWDESKMGWI